MGNYSSHSTSLFLFLPIFSIYGYVQQLKVTRPRISRIARRASSWTLAYGGAMQSGIKKVTI